MERSARLQSQGVWVKWAWECMLCGEGEVVAIVHWTCCMCGAEIRV
jgi:hypothetical protein